jgi:type IV fimbrial biogenesis protein FimT
MQHTYSTQNHGFTLVETLVSLCIACVVLTIAIPSFSKLIAANRISTEVSTLTRHLQLARSEAIKQQQKAVLCPTDNGESCLGNSDWNKGYMVFIDQDADRKRDPEEALIHLHSIDSQATQVDAGQRKTVSYQPSGWAKGSNLTITFCDANAQAQPKAVVVSMTGRPRTTDIHPNGSPLSCS